MKRLALLLAAMGVVSAAAFAGSLQVTSVNQELENEHDNHSHTNNVTFTTTVNMKYDDWSFAIQGGKMWNVNTSDRSVKGDKMKKGLSSEDGRLQLDVWKSLTPEFKLGYRFRGQKDMDRHYIRYDYGHDWFLSSGDIWYESNDGDKNNEIKAEVFPLGATYNGFTARWFVNYNKHIKSVDKGEKSSYEHQIRLNAPIYSDDAFSLSAEGRFTLAAGKSVKGDEGYRYYKNFGRTRLYLNASYKVTDSFSVYGSYGYEFRSFKYKNGATKNDPDMLVGNKNYHDVTVGWNYTF